MNAQIMKDLKLSKTQKRVLVLLMKGFSNSEIADALFITDSGVKQHVTVLYKNSKCPTRHRLIVQLFNQGWKDVPTVDPVSRAAIERIETYVPSRKALTLAQELSSDIRRLETMLPKGVL